MEGTIYISRTTQRRYLEDKISKPQTTVKKEEEDKEEEERRRR